MPPFSIQPVGFVRKGGRDILIEIDKEYQDALLGLEGFSHILVLYWFHENDHPEIRRTLQVHPRKDENNPLMGVFGTHSPARPNLIGITRCKILDISGCIIRVDDIDAFDGSPVIDIKCYIPDAVPLTGVFVPDWVGRGKNK
jgi:tRNA-Thr(GGU) m(6)t(6)A37 methyltransferase TsaA